MSLLNVFNKCETNVQSDGKVAMITGGTSGLGLEAAKYLASRGTKVIITGRRKDKLDNAIEVISKFSRNSNVVGRLVDYGNLTSVRDLATETIAMEPKLDILINNVGAIGVEDKLTPDNLNAMMQVNYFGAFLLTYLLFPLLKLSAPSRVINVSSLASILGHVNPDYMNNVNVYSNFGLYSNAKLANILFAVEMSKRTEGSGVSVYSLDPGLIKTDFFRYLDNVILKKFLNSLLHIFGQTISEAAKAPVYLALDPNVKNYSGKNFRSCSEFGTEWYARDQALNRKLWEKSKELLKISPDEEWDGPKET
ncbi:retinol dehydrogenase 11-like [Galleria mellonella]|uniref:Retinol dehydrogenase 11-like n=1 Tax=Galleria mellonella TaxID=7137 RepID=A0A6J1WAB3_GALME|nr:retinol dehydrogenase 11-like [Galleria mellonella]